MPGCESRASRLVLMAVFAFGTAMVLAPYAYDLFRGIGSDALIYTHAARVWLEGGDPWLAQLPGQTRFAAPPPSLLFYAPGVWLDDAWLRFGWVGLLLVVAAVGLRKIGLPLWWLAFPPMSSAIVNGSLDALLFPAIVLGWGWLAPVAKVYAGIVLLAERQWRQIAIAGVVLLATFPFLPWLTFFNDLPVIAETFRDGAAHRSAWGNPIWMAVGGIALLLLGRGRAGWLAVPVLWPATQTHYAAISVPGLTPVIAAIWSVPFLPGMPVLGVVVAALLSRAGSPRGSSWSLIARRTSAGPARPQSAP